MVRINNKTSCVLATIAALCTTMSAQSTDPYPKAVTDRAIHQETAMTPPSRNVVFTEPDFGSSVVRATDRTTNFQLPGTYLITEASGQSNEWSADSKKFYVQGAGGRVLVFAFDPTTMAISSPPNAKSGQPLLVPIRPEPSFAFTDADLIYGTTSVDPLTITSYRFSTNSSTPIINTRTCGVQPPLGKPPKVVSDDDVTLSLDDSRMSISEGGPQSGDHPFVVVYDKALGCRWYNAQTGQIGGAWGTAGVAAISDTYLIRHAYLSRSGQYVRILTDTLGWYVWDVATLNVTHCPIKSKYDCTGYGIVGYNSYVNSPNNLDDMQTFKRPLSNLSQLTSLYYPLPSPANRGQEKHFTWSNVDSNDSRPACGSSYNYEGDTEINQPYAGEIFCIETDGLASTIWRFAHDRAVWIAPYFQTQPLGSVSIDGKFLIFTSDWDNQLGKAPDGTPRSDAFIVKLD